MADSVVNVNDFEFVGRNGLHCGPNTTAKVTCNGDVCSCEWNDEEGGLNVGGLVGVIIFYLVILGVGLFAAWRSRKQRIRDKVEASATDVMLAKRNISWGVGIMTMTATWVGGGYINGSAEMTYASGFGWCQAPFGFSLSLIFGGLFFAKPMREAGYTTMLDPFQKRFGKVMGAFCFLPALTGELFWSGAILSALGSTLSVILHTGRDASVVVSAVIAVGYTLVGGLLSVAYTDVVQLICIALGLIIACPFAASHAFSLPIGQTDSPTLHPPVNISYTKAPVSVGWVGQIKSDAWGSWVDVYLLLIFGGIPWQVYFQRVLSSRNARAAQVLSFAAGIGCILMVLPPAFIGAIAFSTDWTKVDKLPKGFKLTFDTVQGNSTLEANSQGYVGYLEVGIVNRTYIMPINTLRDSSITLPLVLQYLTPEAVSFIGLGAVAAAVMSSTDSSILGVSSMFANNIYKVLIRPKASDAEMIWVIRGAIVVNGALALMLGLLVKSVYGLFYLCADFVYVILFPQLVSLLYLPFVNVYGSIVGYIIGLMLRLAGGERVMIGGKIVMDMQPFAYYPYYKYDADGGTSNGAAGQLFPFRTFAMVMSFVSLILISLLTHYLFKVQGYRQFDFLRAYDEVEADITLKKIKRYENRGETNYALDAKY